MHVSTARAKPPPWEFDGSTEKTRKGKLISDRQAQGQCNQKASFIDIKNKLTYRMRLVLIASLALVGFACRPTSEKATTTKQQIIIDHPDKSETVYLDKPESLSADSGVRTRAVGGARRVAAIVLTFASRPTAPDSIEQITQRLFTASNSMVAIYRDLSYGAIEMSGEVYGTYIIAGEPAGCDYYSWTELANTVAAQDGFVLGNYDHVIYVYPSDTGCVGSGLGEVAGRLSWIRSGLGDYFRKTASHELGHNLGLYHASTLKCYDSQGGRVPISESCNPDEYGDQHDFMGGILMAPSAFNRARLGVLPSVDTTTVTVSGTYSLSSLASGSGIRSLRIPTTRTLYGKNSILDYYLEYREPRAVTPYDTNISDRQGIHIRLAPTADQFANTYAVDLMPATQDGLDSPLRDGQSFYDQSYDIRITSITQGSGMATVVIGLKGSPAPVPQPTPTPQPSPTPTPSATPTGTGLTGTYFDKLNLTSQKLMRVDSVLDFNWGNGSPSSKIQADTFSVRWTGKVQPAFSGTYTFTASADDGVRVWVNGVKIIDRWSDGSATSSGSITLSADKLYGIIVEYYENKWGAKMQLKWSSPSQPLQVVPKNRLYP